MILSLLVIISTVVFFVAQLPFRSFISEIFGNLLLWHLLLSLALAIWLYFCRNISRLAKFTALSIIIITACYQISCLKIFFSGIDFISGVENQELHMLFASDEGGSFDGLFSEKLSELERDVVLLEHMGPCNSVVPVGDLSFRNLAEGGGGQVCLQLLSKIPFERIDINLPEYLPAAGLYEFKVGQESLVLISLSSNWPSSSDNYYYTYLLYRRLATWLRKKDTSVIIAGNLRTGPGAALYGLMTHEVGLKSAMLGYGVKKTWPASIPLFGLSLSHFLYKGNMLTQDFKVWKESSSEHYPIEVTFRFLNEGPAEKLPDM